MQSRDHGQSGEGSKDFDALKNVAIVPLKPTSCTDIEINNFYKVEKLLREESDDIAHKPNPEQTKCNLKITDDIVEDVSTRSGPNNLKKSAMEKNHMHVNLEPVRAQIMSYLSLLKKMIINHP